MRRCLATVLLLPALVLASCGGGDEAGSPLDEALSYLPKDTPFAVAVDTDVEGGQYRSLGQILKKFPLGGQVEDLIRGQIEQSGRIDFDRDVKPALGNPFVVGGVDPRSFLDSEEDADFVAAIQAKDEGKLENLVEKSKPEEVGEKEGAKLYKDDDGDVFAIKDDVLVVGASRQRVEQAVRRSEGDDHLDEKTFERGLGGLPEQALVRVYVDIQGLIEADPDAREAKKVEWVRALRTLGLAGKADDDGLSVDFRLRTGGDLSEEDLPLAAGRQAPPVVKRAGEIGLGLRDPGQILGFALAAGRSLEPESLEAGLRQVERQLGIDVEDDLIDQLSGDASASVAVDGTFGLRAELDDPRAFKRTLAKVADALPRIAQSLGAGTVALARPKRGEDFYAIAQPDGDSVVFGVVGDVLVVSNDPRRARRLASESPTTVSGAEGSLVISADAEKLVGAVLRRLERQLGLGGLFAGGLFTRPLGDLTASLSSATDGLKGRVRLEIE